MTQEHSGSGLHPRLAEIASQQGPIGEITRDLLENEELRNHPNRGEYIVDRVVGSIAALWSRDRLHSSDPSNTTVAGILDNIAKVANSRDDQEWKQNIQGVTRTDGIRAAVGLLCKDAETMAMLSHVRSAVIDGHEGPSLRSVAQLEGYVYGLADNQHRPWQDMVLDEVVGYVNNPDNPNARWRSDTARKLLFSDNEYIRGHQRTWDEAMREAARDGIDTSVIARSAEAMRAGRRMAVSMGESALVSAMRIAAPGSTPPNLDHLFQP